MTTKIDDWEEAWSDYVFALEMWEADGVTGQDFIHWAGASARRLEEAKCRLRCIDPDFCERLGLNNG